MSLSHEGQERVLHDMPYRFEDQYIYPLDGVVIRSGDVVTTRCTWENTTDHQQHT